MQFGQLEQMYAAPLSIGAAAVYPFKKGWIEKGLRQAKFPDENGNKDFNLFRISGPGVSAPDKTRIWVPRRMVENHIANCPNDYRAIGSDINCTSVFVPRNKEQERVIKETVALLKAGDNFIVEAPTGFGKTWCTTDVISQVAKKTIIVVTKEDVRDQWMEACEKVLGLSRGPGGVGLIQGDLCEVVDRQVCIAMVQSIANFDRYPPWTFRDFGLAVWDEVHRVGADYFSNSCFQIPALLRLGISATPDRKDGREEVIAAHIGPVKVRTVQAPMKFRVIVQESPWYCPTTVKKDKDGRLVMDPKDGKPARVPIPHTAGKAGHIVRMLTHHHERNKVLVNFIVTAIKAGRKPLVQSETKDHLEILASLIASSGIHPKDITFYVGGLTKAQRERAKTGAVIMATYAQTAEATDIPELDTLIMTHPKSDVRQIVGRVIRFLPDKKEPLVFDLRDNTSPLFRGYGEKRDKFYASAGAKVEKANVVAPHIDKQGKSVTIAASIKAAGAISGSGK